VPRLGLGLLAGLILGALAAASMLPMEFADKRAALTAAFLSRFAIGLLIGGVIGSPQVERLGAPGWLVGLAVGLLVSAPDAVITKAYAPILGLGAIGGAIIGAVVRRWGV
jgi:hypothetical protein